MGTRGTVGNFRIAGGHMKTFDFLIVYRKEKKNNKICLKPHLEKPLCFPFNRSFGKIKHFQKFFIVSKSRQIQLFLVIKKINSTY